MRTRFLIVLALLVCWVAPRSVSAQSPPMVNVGAGGRSCGEWLTLQEKTTKNNAEFLKENMLLSWMQGYVVGSAEQLTTLISGNKVQDLAASQKKYGTVSGWVYDPPDSDATKHWVTKYCKDHPLSTIVEASLSLAGEVFTRNPVPK